MKVLFSGLCLFIERNDHVIVALLKGTSESAHHANPHIPLLMRRTSDLKKIGASVHDRLVWPEDGGGFWIGDRIDGSVLTYPPESETLYLPDLAEVRRPPHGYTITDVQQIGDVKRNLSNHWQLACHAIVLLSGGRLTLIPPHLSDFRGEWEFVPDGGDEPICPPRKLAEQVLWDDGDSANPRFDQISNLPMTIAGVRPPEVTGNRMSHDEGGSDDDASAGPEVVHFRSHYDVFTPNQAHIVYIPRLVGNPSMVYPVYCPPAAILQP
jgi:hypothetical protein